MSFIEERQTPGEIRTDTSMNSYTDPSHLIDARYVTAMANEHVEIGRETTALLVRTIVVSRKKTAIDKPDSSYSHAPFLSTISDLMH